ALTWRNFEMEMVLSVVLIFYVIAWYNGKSVNTLKAKQWVGANVEYLQEQFSLVGNQTGTTRSILMKDGPADFLLYLSGRRNVQFGHWWIKANLKPRNDVLTSTISRVLSLFQLAHPSLDKVVLEMTLDVPEKFVFAVLRTSDKAVHGKRYDLKTMTKLANSNLPPHLVVYAESQKMADLLLAKIGNVLHNDRFESLILTSLPVYEPEKFEGEGPVRLHMIFSMAYDGVDLLVQLACQLPDIVGIQWTADIKATLQKNRQALDKLVAKRLAEERAEELVQKKMESKRLEEERIKSLSPSEQRKWEEKERAREVKRAQKKKTKRV
ncbi:hypothetical protein BDF14DRAFT_1731811, partial [Spinellus fusiger]